jgi:hypothetical protein
MGTVKISARNTSACVRAASSARLAARIGGVPLGSTIVSTIQSLFVV